MRDNLTFNAIRRDYHVVVVVRGYDRTGARVEFEIDPVSFVANLRRQIDWATLVMSVETILQSYRRMGVALEMAWGMVEPLLPGRFVSVTERQLGPAVDDVVADGAQELLEGGDDVVGESRDGKG